MHIYVFRRGEAEFSCQDERCIYALRIYALRIYASIVLEHRSPLRGTRNVNTRPERFSLVEFQLEQSSSPVALECSLKIRTVIHCVSLVSFFNIQLALDKYNWCVVVVDAARSKLICFVLHVLGYA